MVSHYCIWKLKLIFHFDEGGKLIDVTISFDYCGDLFGHGGYSVNDHNHLSCFLYEYANLSMTKGLLGVSRFLEAPMETCSLPKISRR